MNPSRALLAVLMAATLAAAAAPASGDTLAATATTDALVDAEVHTSKLLWTAVGAVLGPVGVLGACLFHTDPPLYRLIGKPSSYLSAYGETFSRRSDNIQRQWATIGCVVATLAWTSYALVPNWLR